MKLKDYCKERIFLPVIICFCTLIHMVVLFTYQVPLEPLVYAFLLSIVFLLLFCSYDFFKLTKKHKALTFYDRLSNTSIEKLIESPSIIERDFEQIVSRLEGEIQETITSSLKSNQENADFYMMWVHQIKTPISALHLLQQTAPDNIPAMKNELFKIERYMDVILGYSRLDDMNHDLTLKHYSLDSMVKQAVKKYTPLFIHSQVTLHLEMLSESVLTDEKWLVFVLEQLLSNALKYTPKGSIHIFSQQTQINEIYQTALTIEDTGVGIAAEDLPRIFERGFTGCNGRMDKKASGLGLYLCKTILKRLGHEIIITSVLGEGCKVTLVFHESNENLTTL